MSPQLWRVHRGSRLSPQAPDNQHKHSRTGLRGGPAGRPALSSPPRSASLPWCRASRGRPAFPLRCSRAAVSARRRHRREPWTFCFTCGCREEDKLPRRLPAATRMRITPQNLWVAGRRPGSPDTPGQSPGRSLGSCATCRQPRQTGTHKLRKSSGACH